MTRDALPVHRVYVDAFWMDATEVTNEQFEKFVAATGHITVIEQDNAIAVPAAALREDAEGQFVLKLTGTTLERQPVETVRQWSRGSLIEVTGLETGDQVISSPLAELKPGEAYELVEDNRCF